MALTKAPLSLITASLLMVITALPRSPVSCSVVVLELPLMPATTLAAPPALVSAASVPPAVIEASAPVPTLPELSTTLPLVSTEAVTPVLAVRVLMSVARAFAPLLLALLMMASLPV